MQIAEQLYNFVAVRVIRPYATRELPAWGKLLNLFVDSRGDAPWRDAPPVWGRGKLHGYEMLLELAKWTSRGAYFTGAYYDLGTQHLVAMLLGEGQTFVDIGANEGMISLVASRAVGETGKVIAFEPNPAPRSFLEKAIDRNGITNIRIEPYGVAESDAIMPLHVPQVNSGEGSFGAPDPGSGETYTIECKVGPADPILADCSPDLIKIDVEGFELGALRGIEGTLRRCRPPVIMELIGGHLHRAGTTVDEVRRFMERLGYSCRAIRFDRQLSLVPVTLSEDMAEDVIWSSEALPCSSA
jgi:FkbM family methyltransferase